MREMKSKNPALSAKVLEQFGQTGRAYAGEAMTVEGTINKSALLLLLLVIPATWVWSQVAHGDVEAVMPWMWGGIVGGFITPLVSIFKKKWAPVISPIYVALEGVAIGGLTALLGARYNGNTMLAVWRSYWRLVPQHPA